VKTLKSRLSKEICNFYLVQGEDFYLFERAKELVKSACKLTMPDFNMAFFDDDNFSGKAFCDSCEVFPIGDEYRLIILKGVSKISENDKKQIMAYVEKTVASTIVLILDYQNKFDFLKDEVEFVDAKRMDKDIVTKIIVNELTKYNKKISSEGVEALIDASNGYLTKIQNEIVKLANFSGENELITKAMVDEICIKDIEYTAFELTDALSRKDGDKALKLLSLMEKEPGVFSMITNFFRRMFFISISEMTNQELAGYLGVKEYAITKSRAQLKGFSKNQLRKINKILEEVDYFVKSGKMLQVNALYYMVFTILYI